MREGSGEKGSGCGGKEARCSPSPCWALGQRGPLWGAEGPPGASCAQQGLGSSMQAPCAQEVRAEGAPNIHAPMSFPQSASTPGHHQNPPRGLGVPAGCPRLPPEAGSGGRRVMTTPRTQPGMVQAQPSASPSSPVAQRAEGDATDWHGEVAGRPGNTHPLCLVWAMCF